VCTRVQDVLGWIGWVESLVWREELRQDPSVQWQRDMSYDEMAACVGCWPGGGYAPGEVVANVDLAVELYWPGQPPAFAVLRCAR
jgi:hypothetical protein